MRVAGNGMHELYQHCVGYPNTGLTTPELAKEYFIGHDAGAHIYFSGSPGRTVAQIKGEYRIHQGSSAIFPDCKLATPFRPG